jgi:hypothetical protein
VPAVSIIGVMMAIIALMMEAACTSETSINFYQTFWCNNPEDSHRHTRCCENLKSHSGKKFASKAFEVATLYVRDTNHKTIYRLNPVLSLQNQQLINRM